MLTKPEVKAKIGWGREELHLWVGVESGLARVGLSSRKIHHPWKHVGKQIMSLIFDVFLTYDWVQCEQAESDNQTTQWARALININTVISIISVLSPPSLRNGFFDCPPLVHFFATFPFAFHSPTPSAPGPVYFRSVDVLQRFGSSKRLASHRDTPPAPGSLEDPNNNLNTHDSLTNARIVVVVIVVTISPLCCRGSVKRIVQPSVVGEPKAIFRKSRARCEYRSPPFQSSIPTS